MSKCRSGLRLFLLIIVVLTVGVTILTHPAHAADTTEAAMQDYEATIRKAENYFSVGNYFEAVLSYERARRVAYNNKLRTDTAALEKKLAQARDARDGKLPVGGSQSSPGSIPQRAGTGPAGVSVFAELTTSRGSVPWVLTARDVPKGNKLNFGPYDPASRWDISNPFLRHDARFFSNIWNVACTADGTIYLGAESVVPAEEFRRMPRANRDWYSGVREH